MSRPPKGVGVAQLFVSHSSADNAFAQKLLDALGTLGYESVFLDFDPESGLVPGKAWRDQLFTNVDTSRDGVVTTPMRAALVDLGLEQTAAWDASRSPFPGLRAFDESYAAVFFGRDRQTEQLRQLVDPPSRTRKGAIVPVLGPSGSGKSSLVRAGLVPALRPSPDWVISEPWTPTHAPLDEMAR